MVGSSAVDLGFIPDRSQLRQKSGVGANSANFYYFLKLEILIQF